MQALADGLKLVVTAVSAEVPLSGASVAVGCHGGFLAGGEVESVSGHHGLSDINADHGGPELAGDSGGAAGENIPGGEDLSSGRLTEQSGNHGAELDLLDTLDAAFKCAATYIEAPARREDGGEGSLGEIGIGISKGGREFEMEMLVGDADRLGAGHLIRHGGARRPSVGIGQATEAGCTAPVQEPAAVGGNRHARRKDEADARRDVPVVEAIVEQERGGLIDDAGAPFAI